MKTEMFNSKNTNPNNRKKDIEKKDKDNINLSIANIYLHTIAIMHIRLRYD